MIGKQNKSKDMKEDGSLHEKAIYSNEFIDLRNIKIKEGEELHGNY